MRALAGLSNVPPPRDLARGRPADGSGCRKRFPPMDLCFGGGARDARGAKPDLADSIVSRGCGRRGAGGSPLGRIPVAHPGSRKGHRDPVRRSLRVGPSTILVGPMARQKDFDWLPFGRYLIGEAGVGLFLERTFLCGALFLGWPSGRAFVVRRADRPGGRAGVRIGPGSRAYFGRPPGVTDLVILLIGQCHHAPVPVRFRQQ